MADTGELGAFDIEDANDDELEGFDCPRGADGCPLAGTEECDWECPWPEEDDDAD